MVLTAFGALSSYAQILKVDQEVYGMDCAPCAYGLERSFLKMKALNEVRVSLNDGKAYLILKEDNTFPLRAIQETVKNNGFSARGAEIVLQGQLIVRDNQWFVTTAEEQFLIDSKGNKGQLNKLKKGIIKVRGSIRDVEDNFLDGKWELTIVEIL